jgi:hypothetical protein
MLPDRLVQRRAISQSGAPFTLASIILAEDVGHRLVGARPVSSW